MAVKPVLLPLGAALLAMFGSAAHTGLLVQNAEASFARRREDEDADEPPLLLMPSDDDVGDGLIGHRSHSSHSSHASHASHYSGSTGRSFGSGDGSDYGGDSAPAPAPPPPPKPAVVSLVAMPGGRIFIDGKLLGVDVTRPMALKPGHHFARVENRFLDDGTNGFDVQEGQTGVVYIDW